MKSTKALKSYTKKFFLLYFFSFFRIVIFIVAKTQNGCMNGAVDLINCHQSKPKKIINPYFSIFSISVYFLQRLEVRTPKTKRPRILNAFSPRWQEFLVLSRSSLHTLFDERAFVAVGRWRRVKIE